MGLCYMPAAHASFTWVSAGTFASATISKEVAAATCTSPFSVPFPPHSLISCFLLPLNSWCTWCCVPCALTQESREIALEERSLTGGPVVATTRKVAYDISGLARTRLYSPASVPSCIWRGLGTC